jgi:hypothetical protein
MESLLVFILLPLLVIATAVTFLVIQRARRKRPGAVVCCPTTTILSKARPFRAPGVLICSLQALRLVLCEPYGGAAGD